MYLQVLLPVFVDLAASRTKEWKKSYKWPVYYKVKL